MKRLLRIITWATAFTMGLVVTRSFYNVFQFIDNQEDQVKASYKSLAIAAMMGFSLQIGLFLSPFLIGRNIYLRIFSVVLMAPFVYFILFHDMVVLGRQIIAIDDYYLADWKINFKSHLLDTLFTVAGSFVYGVNIIALFVGRSGNGLDISDDLESNTVHSGS